MSEPTTDQKFTTKVSKVIEAKYHKEIRVEDSQNPGTPLTYHKWAYRMENGDAGFLIGGTTTDPQLPVGSAVAYTMNGQKILPQAMPASTAPLPNGTPPQAEAKPDSATHTGTVKAIKYEGQFKADSPHKWLVTVDATVYVMWGGSAVEPPVREGQTITFSKGKVYSDGMQAISLVAVGGKVDKDTSIIRQSSLKAAVEMMAAIEGSREKKEIVLSNDDAAAEAIRIARIFEQYVSEPIKTPTTTNS